MNCRGLEIILFSGARKKKIFYNPSTKLKTFLNNFFENSRNNFFNNFSNKKIN